MKQKFKKLINRIFRAPVFHKKPLYLVLIIVLSILLLADVAMAVLIPDTGSMGNMQSMQNMQMPDSFDNPGSEDTDAGDTGDSGSNSDADDTESDSTDDSESTIADDNSSSGETGSAGSGQNSNADAPNMDSSEMPGQSSYENGGMPDMADGSAPSFGSGSSENSTDSGADSETDESGGTFDTDDFADAQSSGLSALRILQNIRSHWLLLLIILAIPDAGSIFMLIRISRREKKQLQEEEKALREQAAAGEIVRRTQPVREESNHSHYLWIIAVVLIAVLVILVKIFTRQTSASGTETEATTYSETAASGSIDTVLPGTGTLEEEEAEELSLPTEVEVTKWYVADGDTVEEGDTLAAVDQVSVMTAIASVQENLASLDEALEDCEDDAVSETITAAADARVIKIYASANTSVVDTMYENSALMLLSLDGYMAVSIETGTEISTGDSVAVTLSDGTTVSGKVESLTNTAAVIILSDDGPELGDTVTVETEDGISVGEGTLYIHSELKVTGYTGTVSSVSVSEGDEVDSGDTLIKLTDTDYSAEYETLLEQRSKLEAQMKTLFRLYEDGYIYASCSGIISGLDSSSSSDTGTSSSDSGASADTSTSESSSSDSSTSDDSDSASSESASETSLNDSSGYTVSTLSCTGGTSACLTINTSQSAAAQATLTSETGSSSSSSESTGSSDSSSDDTDDGGNTSDDSSSDDTASEETDSTTVQIGVVRSVSDSSVTLSLLSGGNITVSLSDLSTVGVYQNGSYNAGGTTDDIAEGDILILTCTGDIVSSATCISTSDTASNTGVSTGAAGNQETDGSGIADNSSDASGQADGSEQADSSGQTGEVSDTSSLAGQVTDESGSDMTSDASSMTTTADTASEAETAVSEALTEEVESTYGIDETTLLAITPQDTMTLEITVDEMDILSVEVGQEAAITLDAFPGQSFTGTVTSINESGSNSGGSSKYTAIITMDREDDMLAGMNASAKITLSTTEDVLIIPETALVEQDGSTYVYTTYDEETDTLGDLVEVTTGVSDGTNVEITSGLEEGDTYCYSVLDVVNYSSSYATSGSGSFSAESLFGNGGGMGGF